MVLALVLATPVVGSVSLYEDLRAGGIALFPWNARVPEMAAPDGGVGGVQPENGGAAAGEGAAGEDAAGEAQGGAAGTAAGAGSEWTSGPEGGPITYVVQPGDTLSDISKRYGVTVTDLWIANRLNSPHVLRAGQSLVIPSSRGDFAYWIPPAPDDVPSEQEPAEPVFHRVKTGENLWVIARRYGTTIDVICEVNDLDQGELLPAGLKIKLPRSATNIERAEDAFRVFLPVKGEITSGFGMRDGRMHEGIDIAAPRGTPIVAVASGRVRNTGWMGNYGRALIIDHGSGYATLYAHCDKLLVSSGQDVEMGQTIALLGNTGNSTGPHVHFEVIVHGKRRNPLEYLY